VLPLPQTKKILVCKTPVDMRKSFDGLFAVATQQLKSSPLDGFLYVFFNKKKSMVKLLFWDIGGLCIIAKRLEKGTFEIPVSTSTEFEMSTTDLQLVLEGVKLHSIRYRRRFQPLE